MKPEITSFSRSTMNVEDWSEEEYVPLTLSKRSRFSKNPSPSLKQRSSGNHESRTPSSQLNLLPLGLRLNVTQSFLDLIEMRLSQGNTTSLTMECSKKLDSRSQKDAKRTTTSTANDKLKASNFPASLLRIGNWEYMSSYKNDLVVKCYFAKQKLVWEVLKGGLKSKIEIQWSNITAMKATCPDNDSGTLTIVLAKPPIFFKETNPQPRKHTIWKRTFDFTHGEASINKKHFLKFPPGVLNKHYEKLIQCDTHLYILSQQHEIFIDSPYFEVQASTFKNPKQSRSRDFDQATTTHGCSHFSFKNVELAATVQSPSLSFGQNPLGVTVENVSIDALSSISVMDTCYAEQEIREQLKVSSFHHSMSKKNLVNHIKNCISEQITSGCEHSDKTSEFWDAIENVRQDLLSDTLSATGLDEQSLLKNVDSLCSLLHDPATSSNAKVDYNEGSNCGIYVNSILTSDSMREKTSNDIQSRTCDS